MKEEILRMENVTRERDGITFLDNINLHIFKGEIMGLLSLNSHGKDQLIELICQNIPIKYGRIYFEDQLVNYYEHCDMSQNKVYVIEQKTRLVHGLTVSDNIFVLRRGFKKYVINRRVLDRQAQRYFHELDADINPGDLIQDLSRSDRCIVELVKAVISDSGLIVVHNLSNFLSPLELALFQKIIRHYSRRGYTFLYVGNHHEELFQICSRVTLFDDGRIRKVFDRRELLEEKINPYIISFDLSASKISIPGKSSILEFKNLYTEHLDDMTFSVKKGECVVLLDMDNTSIQDIAGLMNGEADSVSGDIFWEGKPFVNRDAMSSLDNGIAFIGANPIKTTLFDNMSYMENLCFLIDRKLHKSCIKKSIFRSIIREYEPLTGRDIFASNIKGMEMSSLYNLVYYRLHLFCPKIVFCIQPLSWGDMYMRRHILDLIQGLKNKGITIIILAVSISDSLDVADRLLLIQKGHMIKEYSEKEFYLFQR